MKNEKAIIKITILEAFRARSTFLSALLFPVVFGLISALYLQLNANKKPQLPYPKEIFVGVSFLSFPLLYSVITFSFQENIYSIIEKKINGTFSFFRLTNLTIKEYILGNLIGNILVFNVLFVFTLILFTSITKINNIFYLFFVGNLTFIYLFILAYIASANIKK
jgi:hypothetical protein